jgi:hypothetical protein
MSHRSKAEYLAAIHERYLKATRAIKKVMLDEFCAACDYHRKHAIRLLQRKTSKNTSHKNHRRGPKRRYDHPLISKVLKTLWVAANLPCSKRLKALIPLWLPFYEYELPKEVEHHLKAISAATIDRLMKPWRAKYHKRGLTTTKPGALIRKHIPVKTNQWDETRPGFVEIDAVAHGGASTAGMFVYTIDCVDIATGWTEQRAVWGKGERGVFEAVKSIEAALPFPLLGFDSDNGSEFLNWHLYRYLTQERQKPVQFTRSRAYHKNDNAHVENKNWTHVRQFLGYERFDKPEFVDMLNRLYTTEWRHLLNYFLPSVKLITKERVGSKIIKKYDTPQTPVQRLLNSATIAESTKQLLRAQLQALNPFQLQQQVVHKIKAILQRVQAQQN